MENLIDTLKKIDWKIICAFQYIVRQIELYTPITLKLLILTFIGLSALCFMFIGVLFNIPTFKLFSFCMVVFFSFYFLHSRSVPSSRFWYKSMIYTRIFSLILFMVKAPFSFCVLLISKDLLILPLLINIISLMVVMYLLCCDTLPPGEKDRKKKEREIQKEQSRLQPQAG